MNTGKVLMSSVLFSGLGLGIEVKSYDSFRFKSYENLISWLVWWSKMYNAYGCVKYLLFTINVTILGRKKVL